MGALPLSGAPQGGILYKKTKNGFLSLTTCWPIELKVGIAHQRQLVDLKLYKWGVGGTAPFWGPSRGHFMKI